MIPRSVSGVIRKTLLGPATARQLTVPRLLAVPKPQSRPFTTTPRTLAEVKYIRFGDSGGSGNKWRPFAGGKWDTPSKILAGAVATGGVYYVYQ